jgi:hypothetical protein
MMIGNQEGPETKAKQPAGTVKPSEDKLLDCELGLGAGAAAVGAVGVTRKLEELGGLELENLLEATTDGEEDVAALIRSPALSTSNVAITTARDVLADCACPDTNSEEGLADVDDNTHDLTVLLFL